MPITRYMGGHYSSWVPWHMVLVTEQKPNGVVAKFSGVWSYSASAAETIVCKSAQGGSLPSQNSSPQSWTARGVSKSPTSIPKLPQRHFCPWIDANYY